MLRPEQQQQQLRISGSPIYTTHCFFIGFSQRLIKKQCMQLCGPFNHSLLEKKIHTNR